MGYGGSPWDASVCRRRSPELRLYSVEGNDARVDWSNLTSGPGEPTVSDPAPVHAGISGGVFLEYVFDVYLFETFSFLFPFYLKTRNLTKL